MKLKLVKCLMRERVKVENRNIKIKDRNSNGWFTRAAQTRANTRVNYHNANTNAGLSANARLK